MHPPSPPGRDGCHPALLGGGVHCGHDGRGRASCPNHPPPVYAVTTALASSAWQNPTPATAHESTVRRSSVQRSGRRHGTAWLGRLPRACTVMASNGPPSLLHPHPVIT